MKKTSFIEDIEYDLQAVNTMLRKSSIKEENRVKRSLQKKSKKNLREKY